MGDEFVPEGEVEMGVSAVEARNEVVFERVDGTFSCIVHVDERRGKLECYVFLV